MGLTSDPAWEELASGLQNVLTWLDAKESFPRASGGLCGASSCSPEPDCPVPASPLCPLSAVGLFPAEVKQRLLRQRHLQDASPCPLPSHSLGSCKTTQAPGHFPQGGHTGPITPSWAPAPTGEEVLGAVPVQGVVPEYEAREIQSMLAPNWGSRCPPA